MKYVKVRGQNNTASNNKDLLYQPVTKRWFPELSVGLYIPKITTIYSSQQLKIKKNSEYIISMHMHIYIYMSRIKRLIMQSNYHDTWYSSYNRLSYSNTIFRGRSVFTKHWFSGCELPKGNQHQPSSSTNLTMNNHMIWSTIIIHDQPSSTLYFPSWTIIINNMFLWFTQLLTMIIPSLSIIQNP